MDSLLMAFRRAATGAPSVVILAALVVAACEGQSGSGEGAPPEASRDDSPAADVLRDLHALPGARTYVHTFGAVPQPCSNLFEVLGGEVVDSRTTNMNGTEEAQVVVSIHVRAKVASDDAYCFGSGPWGAGEERWVNAEYRAERWDSGWRLYRPNRAGIGR